MQRTSPGGGKWLALGLAGLASLLLSASVLAHLHSSGTWVLRWQRIQLASSEMAPESGHCYLAPLGHGDWMSAHLGPSIAYVLEDGRPLGPPNANHEAIRLDGGGRYSFWHDRLLFSSSDGSDPRLNGRRYEVHWPHPVERAWLWFIDAMIVVLVGLVAWSGYDSYSGSLREATAAILRWFRARGLTDPLVVATIVGLCAWGVRLASYGSMACDPRFITGSSVMGVPFSDARGWDNLGEAVAQGEGLRGPWSARRPFYAIFLGLVYAWTGASFAVAIHVNLLLAALTAGLIFRIGTAVYHPFAGLAAGLAFAIDPGAIEQSLTTLSETVGLFLFVLSLHLLVQSGLERNLGKVFGGGVALALANLARPVAVGLEPVVAVILSLSPWRTGPGLRGIYRAPVLFLLALVLMTTPWLVRQRIVHGMATLSDNGPAVLYAVSSPEHRTWSAAVDREAQAAGVPPDLRARHAYFSKALVRNLRERPHVFFENAWASARHAFDGWGRQPWPTRALVATAILLFALGSLGRMANSRAAGVWMLLCGSSLLAVFCVPGNVLLLVAGAGLIARALTGGGIGLLLPAALLTSLLGLAISGLGGELRLLVTMSWVVPCASTFAGIVLLGGTAARREETPKERGPLARGLGRGLRGLTYVVVVLAVVTATYLAARTLWPPPLTALGVPSLAEERMVFARVQVMYPDLFAPGELEGDGAFFRPERGARPGSIEGWHGKLVVMLARVDRHRYLLPRGLVVAHYARMFAERDYRRTFFYAFGRMPDGTPGPELAIMGGALPDIDPAQPVLVAGRTSVDMRFPYEELLLEVMAVVPPGSDGRPDWDRLRLAKEPGHLARLKALRPH